MQRFMMIDEQIGKFSFGILRIPFTKYAILGCDLMRTKRTIRNFSTFNAIPFISLHSVQIWFIEGHVHGHFCFLIPIGSFVLKLTVSMYLDSFNCLFFFILFCYYYIVYCHITILSFNSKPCSKFPLSSSYEIHTTHREVCWKSIT